MSYLEEHGYHIVELKSVSKRRPSEECRLEQRGALPAASQRLGLKT